MRRGQIIIALFLTVAATAWGTDTNPQAGLTLSQAIETALHHNYFIQEIISATQASEADIQSAGADFFPKASTHYAYTRLQDEPFQKISGIPRRIGDEDSHHWDVTLVQPLFKGFAIASRYEMANISNDIKTLEKRQVILDVSREVKIAWFESLLAGKIETLAEETVRALQSHEIDAERFLRQGLIPRNDLLKSKVALANAVQEKERSGAAAKIARSALYTVMGIELNENPMEEDAIAPPAETFDLSALTAEAVKNRPYLAALRLGVTHLEKSVTAAKSAYYPEVSLVGRYEENGRDPLAKHNDYNNGHNSSVSLQAGWTFFEGGKTNADVSRQIALKASLVERVKGIEDRVRLETKTAYLELQVAGKNIATAREALEQARENWRITTLQYRLRVTVSTEVLDAQAFLTQAETNYYRALYGYRIALAKLENAVGR